MLFHTYPRIRNFCCEGFHIFKTCHNEPRVEQKVQLYIYFGWYRNARLWHKRLISKTYNTFHPWQRNDISKNFDLIQKNVYFPAKNKKLGLNVHVYNMHMRLLLRLYYMNLGPYGPLSFMLSGFSQLFCTGMCLWLGDPKNSSVVGYLQSPRSTFWSRFAKKSKYIR